MTKIPFLAAGLTLLCAAPAAADQRPFTLDLGHAYVGWEIDHFGYSNTVGQFRTFDGAFLIDETAPEKSEISFTIEAASIDSNHKGRDNHLRSAEFLDVEKHPKIEFVSTKIKMNDEKSGAIEGDLTFKGVTKPFSMDFRITDDAPFAAFLPRYDERRAVGFEAEGRFDRLAHGFDVLNFEGSPLGQFIDLKINFDLVDCADAPTNNIPCQYGRNDALEFPYE
ncbi:MAG: YceI family protein [Pseudomonadota bacterium]